MEELFQIKRKPAFICINYNPVSGHPVKLVFFAPYPWNEAPSQRFRYEQYLDLLRGRGFKITLFSFYNQSTWKKLYSNNSVIWQLGQLVKGLFLALFRTIRAVKADYIFIHREVAPVGPPLVEWLLAKVLRKKIIYDFDDAIWLTDKTNESRLEKIIRWRSKVASICKWSYKVSCGNDYLASYARKFNSNVVVNPTTIDTENLHKNSFSKPSAHSDQEDLEEGNTIIIGWTGSHSTLKYLEGLTSVLVKLEKKYNNVLLLVIADKTPQLPLKRMVFKKWSKETEAEDLATIDIGIMPLPDDEWTKGKCGFKALQYMSMGVPALVSPVAVNMLIVQNGENGFWCSSDEEWIEKISILIEDVVLRKQLGTKARMFVEHHYSVNSNAENFIQLFS